MTFDRMGQGLETIIRRVVEPQINYLGKHLARVVQQAADGTLEVEPYDDRVPPMTLVEIRYGVPGVTAKIAPGTDCVVEFEGGSPRRPIVTGFTDRLPLELTLNSEGTVIVNGAQVLLGDGMRAVACVGDTVMVSGIAVTGNPAIILVTPSGPVTGPITLTGQIMPGGQGKVKA